MEDKHAIHREKKYRKKRYGMQESGRKVKLLLKLMNDRLKGTKK